MSKQQPTQGRWKIKPFDYGENRHLLVPEEANLIVNGLNRIHSMEVVRGNADQVLISDQKITIQLKATEAEAATSETNFPFEILQPNAGTANFKDIQINAGNLWAYPSPEDMAAALFTGSHISAAIFNFNTTITLPASAAIYVFIQYSGGGWSVAATDTDDGSWLEFGSTDNKHFVIGFIDAVTNAGSQQLIVSQYVRSDVTWPIGGKFADTLYDAPLMYAASYNGSRTYVKHSSVVKGTIAQGFPADGTYLFTGTGTDIGPGSDFIAL